MGRATSRGSSRGGPASSASSSGSGRPYSSSLSEFDPANPANLKRSLGRNDVELAALSKLHVALRTLREAIVSEFGEKALIRCVLDEKEKLPVASAKLFGNGERKKERRTKEASEEKKSGGRGEGEEGDNGDDDGVGAVSGNNDDEPKSEKQKRLEQLATAFLLRTKLRRRLLNRLARRLHRVAHIMDGGSNVSAPLPPMYGDVVRRYVTEENERNGLAARVLGGGGPAGGSSGNEPEKDLDQLGVRVIREHDIKEFEKREEKMEKIRWRLEERRRMRSMGEGEGGKADEGGYEAESESMDGDKESVDEEGNDEAMDMDKAEADSSDKMKKEENSHNKDQEKHEGANDDDEAETNSIGGAEKKVNSDDDAEKEACSMGDEEEKGGSVDDAEEKADSTYDDADSSDDEDKGEDKEEKVDSMDVDKEESPERIVVKGETTRGVVDADEDADADTDAAPTTEVDLLLQGDEEDRPLLDRLLVYEPGYDKMYSTALPPLPSPSTPSSRTASPNAEDNTFGGKSSADSRAVTPASGTDIKAATKGKKQVVKVTMPIAFTVDDHEVNEEGEFLSKKPDEKESTRIFFSLYGSTYTRTLHPKERAADWKRWTQEMCERIPDQVTFEELGIGGVGCVFDLEERLKRLKRKREEATVHEDNARQEEKEANRGKGKVLRKSSPEKVKLEDDEEDVDEITSDAETDAKTAEAKPDDGPSKMQADAAKEKKAKSKASAEVTTKKSSKTFSLVPVPSFYYQDLQRIKNVQNEMVKYRTVQHAREKVLRAQLHYEKAFKISVNFQQRKAEAMVEYTGLIEANRAEAADAAKTGKAQLSRAREHWEKRQFQLKDMQAKLGPERAFVRNVSNDVIQDLKDRVCIRTAERLTGSGLGTHRLKKVAELARDKGDENREVSATVLGHMIDCVDRRYLDAVANSPRFAPPRTVASADTVIADPATGETMAQLHARKLSQLKKRIGSLDLGFKKAEKARGQAWEALTRAKGGTTGGGSSSSSRSRSKSRKSSGAPGVTSSSNARVAAAAAVGNAAYQALTRGTGSGGGGGGGQSRFPMQMQTVARPGQPRPSHPAQLTSRSRPGSGAVPGYVPASYYQGVRGAPTAAAQMAAAARRSPPNVASSLMAARMAAAGYLPGQVAGPVTGRMAGQTVGNRAQIAQIAAMRTMMAQQHQSQQKSGSVARAEDGGRPVSGGVQFHPVQNVSRTSAHANVAGGASSVASSATSGSNAEAATAQPGTALVGGQPQPLPLEQVQQAAKVTTLSKYGYGDKYSATNVNARKNPDGTVVPASAPKLLPDGRYARPAGRQRKGMDWDSVNGWWVPLPEGWEQREQQQRGGSVGGSAEGDNDSQQGNALDEGKEGGLT